MTEVQLRSNENLFVHSLVMMTVTVMSMSVFHTVMSMSVFQCIMKKELDYFWAYNGEMNNELVSNVICDIFACHFLT